MIRSREMRTAYLQQKKKIRNQMSGSAKDDWDEENQKKIQVAIFNYEFSKFKANGIRYAESTHTALTREKSIKKGIFRIIQDGTVYNVMDVKDANKYTLLMLKVVETNV